MMSLWLLMLHEPTWSATRTQNDPDLRSKASAAASAPAPLSTAMCCVMALQLGLDVEDPKSTINRQFPESANYNFWNPHGSGAVLFGIRNMVIRNRGHTTPRNHDSRGNNPPHRIPTPSDTDVIDFFPLKAIGSNTPPCLVHRFPLVI